MLSSVAIGTGSAALWAVATGTGAALGVAHALVSPVLGAGRDTLDAALVAAGRSSTGPRLVWADGRRAHLDIRTLLGPPHSPRHDARVDAVASATQAVPGVASAHVEAALGRVVVVCAPERQIEQVGRRVLDALVALDAAGDHNGADGPDEPRTVRMPDPGDRSSVVAPAVAAAMDAVAVAGAVAGQLARLPAAPRAVRAAVAAVQHQPRLVRTLEARLGRVGTDVLLTAAAAAAHGFGQAPAVPLLDLAQRVAQIGEALAHRQSWAEWEPNLAVPTRPSATALPTPSSAGNSAPPRRPATYEGAAPGVAVDTATEAAVDAGDAAVVGEIESYLDQAASGTLVAAAGALVASGSAEDIAGAVLAGVPKAAHLGRESFAAVLGRGLARTGLLLLDVGALRRLDRVKVVVIDGAALRGDARMVLRAEGRAAGWDTDRVYEVADALLHRENPPGPDPDEPPADGARLRWTSPPTSTSDGPGPQVAEADGTTHGQLVVADQVVGVVEVGWEPDPYALALVETARRTDATVVLRHVAGTGELTTGVTQSYPPDTPLSEVVRTARAERGPVMLISALRPDLASDDTVAAFAMADVSVAVDDPAAAVAWHADIVTGPRLVDAVRVLSALPAARRSSSASVRLAKAGSTLEGLLVVTGGPTDGRSRFSVGRWLSPVHATAATAMIAGALSARGALGLPDPEPVPLTAWHALDPEVVFTRLTGGPAPLSAASGTPGWRRRLDELSEHDTLAPLRDVAIGLARVSAATRAELNDPLSPVLAVGAAASAILGSGVDAALVAGVMAVNALVGGVQRLRAENAVAQLFAEQDQLARRVVIPVVGSTGRRLRHARTATRTHTITATRLRAGDVIELRAPDVVPADARLLSIDDLEVDESSLTGESVPVTKQCDPVPAGQVSERASMVFEGSTIVAGTARAIVVATGTATAAHRAISTVAGRAPEVGVAARLGELTSKSLPLTLAGGAVVTGLSLLRGQRLRQAVADGVAIAVTAVPEGLPLVATVAQLAAARRLSARGVLVRASRAVEALGRVDTVCFDKTGTLTENKLRVITAATPDWDPSSPPPSTDDPEAVSVLRAAARACPHPTNGHSHAHATDEAILTASTEATTDTDTGWTVLAEIPFESGRGYAATLGRETARSAVQRVLVVKGAPEVITERCQLSPAALSHAATAVDSLARQGLRVLAIATRTIPDAPHDEPDVEPDSGIDADSVDALTHDMRLLGYVGLADTVRPSATQLLHELMHAGREVVLITGDHPTTAAAIATQLGLASDSQVVTGAELADLDEAGRAKLAGDARIFARVSPEQKVQVVEALQQAGRICAMVGDGANDAAAIRMATVGIGVSSRGSSAARSAADLVLTEGDLTVLLDALVEGRNMWASVRDALVILLGGNAGEVGFTLAGTALGGRAPMSTRQLLLVNLLTDMFPALAVAVTPQQPDSPRRDAQTTEQRSTACQEHRHTVLTAPTPSLDGPLVREIITRGVTTAAGATLAWGTGHLTPGTRRRSATMGLTALVATQLAQTLLTRHRSPLVLATSIGSAAVLVGIVQTPGVSHFFGCTPLGPFAWTTVLATTATAAAASIIAPAQFARPEGTPATRSNGRPDSANTE